MKENEIKNLFEQFETIACEYEGIECWSARELQKLLDYSKWENFSKVIEKAKESCKNAHISVVDHFPDVRKVIEIGKGGEFAMIDIIPENLPPAEDVKKVERRLQGEQKKLADGRKTK